MKKYISLFFIAFSLILAGCVDEQPTREPSPTDIPCGVYFLPSSGAVNPLNFTVDAEDTEFTYHLGRTSSQGSVTVNIINNSDPIFNVPTSVTFIDGELTAPFTVKFANVPATNTSINFEVEPAYVALYGAGSAKFNGVLNCLWEKLGIGQWYDSWAQYNTIQEVEVLKSKIPPLRYRVLKPYTIDALNADDWGDWIDTSLIPEYVELFVADPVNGIQYITWDKFWTLGLNYQGTKGNVIKAYLPSALSSSMAADDANSFVYSDISDKLFQLVPYMYIDGLGGYGLKQVLLSLPGGPNLYDLL
ncbi:MAG: hypothetical protein WC128_06800 [Bacteroidales bacterium]|jgi:hypothetical protein